MTISVRLSEKDSTLFKKYAQLHGLSLSELIRQSILERIEDEYDLALFEEVMAEYEKNPVTFSHEEVKRMLEEDV